MSCIFEFLVFSNRLLQLETKFCTIQVLFDLASVKGFQWVLYYFTIIVQKSWRHSLETFFCVGWLWLLMAFIVISFNYSRCQKFMLFLYYSSSIFSIGFYFFYFSLVVVGGFASSLLVVSDSCQPFYAIFNGLGEVMDRTQIPSCSTSLVFLIFKFPPPFDTSCNQKGVTSINKTMHFGT